jgi:hypothetical protein
MDQRVVAVAVAVAIVVVNDRLILAFNATALLAFIAVLLFRSVLLALLRVGTTVALAFSSFGCFFAGLSNLEVSDWLEAKSSATACFLLAGGLDGELSWNVKTKSGLGTLGRGSGRTNNLRLRSFRRAANEWLMHGC